MNLLLVGMSHHTASLEMRERYAVADAGPAVAKLAADPEIEEAVLLSTCNRVEVLVVCRHLEAARARLRRLFARELAAAGSDDGAALAEALYELVDGGAVRHLFRVACAVDSMVVGEPQILGQVKDAYRTAVEVRACGPVLGRLYQRAFATAKRVRNETRIAERPVSVARVAVDLAREIFESLEDKAALLVGAGEMTELALETLRAQGLAEVRVANRTPARAFELARRFDATAHGLDELPALLARSDVVLTSIGGDGPLLTPALLEEALRHRRGRALFLIDIGVPRNVDPAAHRLDNVFLYDLDDLQSVAESNAAERRREVERAEAIVDEERQRFDGWLSALQAVPTIRRLRARAEAVRTRELSRWLARMDLPPETHQAVEALTRAIVNKILHAPISRLREEVEREEGLAHLEAART
ncbi:MAG: glutamyl-tRNA reductase, partial [Myxococcota bacterium]|nr:glutamyl-tRNA reductase [Myxococcota bacterium]